MARDGFNRSVLRRLARIEGERLDAERRREDLSAGTSNTYRDRRDYRSPSYQSHVRRLRKLGLGGGMLLGLIVSSATGINELVCWAAFAIGGVLVAEQHIRTRRRRDRHFD